MSPETIESWKTAAMLIGTALGTGAAAWAARGRRERSSAGKPTVYTGPPDDQPRKITRKEWHTVSDFADAYSRRMPSVRRHLARHDQEIADLRGEFRAFGIVFNSAAMTLARLEERFSAHVERWEAGSERAQLDRQETNVRLERIERKLDGDGGNAS